MAVYQAPEGYSFDPASGLWVKKMVVSDKNGVQYDHRYYFNADTGEYKQESFPLSGNTAVKVKSPKTKKKIIVIATVAFALIFVVAFAVSFINRNNSDPYVFSDEELTQIYEKYSFDTIPDSVIDLRDYEGVINEGGIIR